MKIAVDSDEAGIALENVLIEHLHALGAEVYDLNLLGHMKVDYPDVGYNLARRVADSVYARGVLICGTGLGMCKMANKVKGIYAGVVTTCTLLKACVRAPTLRSSLWVRG